MTDDATREWIRNPSDELAVENGCRFDVERAQFVVDWIQKYCVLYEGDAANQPMILDDWQLDCTMRMFGWVRWSAKWNRWVRRFTHASIWIPKKNGKSPTLAAWGLYLLIGDGEPGQKVFFAAKDGAQARDIAGKHAIEMLRRSPELDAACKVNNTTSQITHLLSSSIMRPLSSANSRHKDAKEGVNGCVLIDETHVVDRDMVAIIDRAGISRSEPFQIEVSTAGSNPEGYGKERFDYATSVLSGSMRDDTLFAAIYAAPQDISEAQLAEDPLKFGRMANPALGRLIDPEEFLRDYERSKGSITKLGKFLMYRLNVWQASASPWIKLGDWADCYEAFTADDMRGDVAYGGLDLSKVNDFTAWSLIFPRGRGAYRQLVWYWMPEETARSRSHLASYLDWAQKGFIKLIPGRTIDDDVVIEDIVRICEQFRVKAFAYDPLFANDYRIGIEEQSGAEGYEFRQRTLDYANPTSEYEKLLLNRKLRHNGHPVLAWQAGHVEVYRDPNGSMRPTRKNKDDHRTIDGVASGIMGLAMAMDKEKAPPPSIYATRGVRTL